MTRWLYKSFRHSQNFTESLIIIMGNLLENHSTVWRHQTKKNANDYFLFIVKKKKMKFLFFALGVWQEPLSCRDIQFGPQGNSASAEGNMLKVKFKSHCSSHPEGCKISPPHLTPGPLREWRAVAALRSTPQVQPSQQSARHRGNRQHFHSLWYDPAGNRTQNLPVSQGLLWVLW